MTEPVSARNPAGHRLMPVQRGSVFKKLADTMLLALGFLGVSMLIIVALVDVQTAERHAELVQTHIENGIVSKGTVLTRNHALALRGLTLDNAFLDMQRLIDHAVTEDVDVVYGVYVETNGKTLAFRERAVPNPPAQVAVDAWDKLKAQLSGGDSTGGAPGAEVVRRTSLRGVDVLEVADPVLSYEGAVMGTVRYGLSMRRMTEALAAAKSETRNRLVGGLVLLALLFGVSTLLGVLLSRKQAARITRPLADLTNAADRMGTGTLDVKVDIRSGDELELLGRSFNAMVDEIGRSRAALTEQAKTTRELEIATSIQRALLPPDPTHPEFEFAGEMEPAESIGGDFYDVLVGQNRLWVTIGDVSGHGLGAGLVMLMVQSAFQSHFQREAQEEPAQVLSYVNGLIIQNVAGRLRDDKYVTCQMLSYEGKGTFTMVGGHQWPLIFRQATGECKALEVVGPWLGVVADLSDVARFSVTLEPGDVIGLYTDGIIEARNAEGEQYDQARLESALATALNANVPLADVVRQVLAQVNSFAPDRDDDRSLLLLRRRAVAPTV